MVKSDILDCLYGQTHKMTVIASGLKVVVVQYFINTINVACGWLKFTRYYRTSAIRSRSQRGGFCSSLNTQKETETRQTSDFKLSEKEYSEQSWHAR